MKCDKLIYKRLYHKKANGEIIEVYPIRDVNIAIYELKNLIEGAGIHNTNLEREVKKYKRAFSLENKEKRTLEKQLRKQKYKRCLKLSKYCFLRSYIACYERDAKSWVRWLKWNDRWLEIAKKLKEKEMIFNDRG